MNHVVSWKLYQETIFWSNPQVLKHGKLHIHHLFTCVNYEKAFSCVNYIAQVRCVAIISITCLKNWKGTDWQYKYVCLYINDNKNPTKFLTIINTVPIRVCSAPVLLKWNSGMHIILLIIECRFWKPCGWNSFRFPAG